jgi:hypothetical protein
VTTRPAIGLLSVVLTLHAGCVSYDPRPIDAVPFRERVVSQEKGKVKVSVAALGQAESALLFGVPLSNQGIQPVWLEIANDEERSFLFLQQGVDPDYFAAQEAAFRSRFSATRRVLGYGLASFLFLPLLLAAPFQYFSARSANTRMVTLFEERAMGNRIVEPGERASGFVFTHIDEGTKSVPVELLGAAGPRRFELFPQVPGVRLDHHDLNTEDLYAQDEIRSLDLAELHEILTAIPCCTTSRDGNRDGDPANLIVIGDFDELLQTFTRARWDETELIDVTSSVRTARSFVLGSHYRYSPVSNLYLWGRKQDVAFQKARETVRERNHLRLWLSPYRYAGKDVWVGQVSRDIGVKFTWRTWNLTTHAIDSDIDDSRENLIGDLLQTRRVAQINYLAGVGASTRESPARNLMDDPYFTDGRRALVVLSDQAVEVGVFRWKVEDR